MAKRVLSEDAYVRVKNTAQSAGSATHVGEERRQKGLGLDPLVDPKGHGLIRRSLCRFEEISGRWVLPNGVAMPNETLFDGTGSIGRTNIETGLDTLKLAYDQFSQKAFHRYDPQLATAMFGDTEDQCVLQRTQFEMDVEIAREMTMFDPHGFNGQGNYKENPEYGLFGATFLTDFDIWRYGLRSYHHTLSDDAIVHRLDSHQLERIYGNEVWEKVKENGHEGVDSRNLPTTPEMLRMLLKRTHAFFYLFREQHSTVRQSWTKCYGRERVIDIPEIRLFTFYQSLVNALTEGVVDLQSGVDYLRDSEKSAIGKGDAKQIVEAVSHIPLGAQAILPNFLKIPPKGSFFAEKRGLWPMTEEELKKGVEPSKKDDSKTPKKTKTKRMWL